MLGDAGENGLEELDAIRRPLRDAEGSGDQGPLGANPFGRGTTSPGVGEGTEITSGRRKGDRPKADYMKLQPQAGPSARAGEFFGRP